MAGTTTKGLHYPQNADAPNVAVDIQTLAEDIDTLLDDYSAESNENNARSVLFMLGGM